MSECAAGKSAVVRWWWGPATVSAAIVGGGIWLVLASLLGYAVRPHELVQLLSAHLVAAVVTVMVLAVVDWHRATRRYVNLSNPFWTGVGYGLLAAVASAIVFGTLDTRNGIVPGFIGALWLSVLTFEFVVMCLVGALAWGWLTIRTGPMRR